MMSILSISAHTFIHTGFFLFKCSCNEGPKRNNLAERFFLTSTCCISIGVGRVTCRALDHTVLCVRDVAILRPGLEWADVCVSGGRRSAERWGMARGYLAMCCETVLTQDTASSYNNSAADSPGHEVRE